MSDDTSLTIYRSLIERGLAALDEVLRTAPPGDALAVAGRTAHARSDSAVRDAQDRLAALRAAVALAWGDHRFTTQERRRQADEVNDSQRPAIEAAVTTVEAEVEALRQRARSAALPPLPTDDDPAAQAARIAGIKTDAKMVLDAVPANLVGDELVALVKHYHERGDALAEWVLCTSDFADLYLRSRGRDAVAVATWRHRLPDALTVTAGDNAAQAFAQRLLTVLDGPKGLAGTILAFRQLVRTCLDDIASYRPAA